MTFWANFFKAIGYLWLVAAGLFVLIGVVGVWITEGLAEVPGWLSPFRVINWIVAMLAVVPGLAFLMLAARLRGEVSTNVSVLRSYEAVLEETIDVLVVDEKRLPASKDEVKAAIMAALERTREPKRRAFLQNAYMDLALFQADVGEEPVALDLSPTPAPEGYEAIVSVASSIAARNPEIKRWSGVTARESDQLLDELRSAGFGSGAQAGDKGRA